MVEFCRILKFDEDDLGLKEPVSRGLQKPLNSMQSDRKISGFEVREKKNSVSVCVNMSCDDEREACKRAMKRKIDELANAVIEKIEEKSQALYEEL